MVLVDLRDAFFQFPIHPGSMGYLGFCFRGKVSVFTLCFGLSAAPQVFTWVFTTVARRLRGLGSGVCSSSTIGCFGPVARGCRSCPQSGFFQFFAELGLVINRKK